MIKQIESWELSKMRALKFKEIVEKESLIEILIYGKPRLLISQTITPEAKHEMTSFDFLRTSKSSLINRMKKGKVFRITSGKDLSALCQVSLIK